MRVGLGSGGEGSAALVWFPWEMRCVKVGLVAFGGVWLKFSSCHMMLMTKYFPFQNIVFLAFIRSIHWNDTNNIHRLTNKRISHLKTNNILRRIKYKYNYIDKD